eukprot:TRINITY_DN3559_c0_g3_i7.p2 TRINITY_DN3559_c0_g3~~TRINITY_DN3559_c0_g3_i7.p2  ORF type:complete len:198 (-),score=10.57 TRINITY_DN3559_c0_g3_i7:2-595(-)
MQVGNSVCAATMIKDNVAITSGSCFYKLSEEVLEDTLQVEFYNGWTIDVEEIKFMDSSNVDISISELFSYKPNKLEGVIVILKLKVSVGYLTGWLGLPNSEFEDLNMEVSMVEFGNNRMTRQECALQGSFRKANFVYHDCNTQFGKGWPLYNFCSEQPILVALHARPINTEQYSKGLSLQGTLSTLLKNVIQQTWDN